MKTDNYRVFPVFFLAFTRVATGVAIGLAIPLYLIEIGLSPEIIGIITSGTAMAYLFSPLIFRNVQKKLGVKPTIIISSLGFLFIQVILQFSKDPLLIYFLLILDGTFLGLFWPILMGVLSAISNSEEYHKNNSLKDKLMKKYSVAWNFGGIFS
jgi:MFS family permease